MLLLLFFICVALVFYLPMLVAAGIIAVGAVIYYFATIDWSNSNQSQNGVISLIILVAVIGILALLYQSVGVWAVVIAIVLILAFVGSTS